MPPSLLEPLPWFRRPLVVPTWLVGVVCFGAFLWATYPMHKPTEFSGPYPVRLAGPSEAVSHLGTTAEGTLFWSQDGIWARRCDDAARRFVDGGFWRATVRGSRCTVERYDGRLWTVDLSSP